MLHENSECRNPNLTSYKEKTLLSKYDIPIDHLSYEYIEQCNVVKELERIVRILRSGEEGFYPNLIKKAEEKLRSVSSNNRLLTVEEPALTKYTMEQDDWNGTIHDLKVWTDEMKVRDNELSEANNSSKAENCKYPPVRKDTTKQKPPPTSSEANMKNKRIPSIDYTTWDKYDADTEMLKMDVEEDKKRQELRKMEKKKEEENSRLKDVIAQSGHLSEVEKKFLAEQEKNRGNEYFNAKDYNEAIKYYTASIAITPTAIAHNNRAMCYLKMCKYTAALEDTNKAIEMDPNNVKAYFRRGLALQHKNKFQEALADMQQVLKREPHHTIARHIANDLSEQCLSIPRKIRVLIEDRDSTGARRKKIVQVSEEEYKNSPKLQAGIEVNEWGLPKIMCNCKGVPPFVRLTTYPPKIAEHVLATDPNKIKNKQLNESVVSSAGSKIVELNREENNGNYYSGDEKTDRPKRLEIMEVDNVEECSGGVLDNSSKPMFSVVDMRGKESGDKVNSSNNDLYKGTIPKSKMVNGDVSDKENFVNNNDLYKSGAIPKTKMGYCDLIEKENSVSNNDFYKSGAIPKTKMVNGDCYVHSKAVKTSANMASKEQHETSDLEKCYKKPSITVANKYKNMIKDHSEYNDSFDLEEINEIGSSVCPSRDVKISPFQFYSVWTSKSADKQADKLRRVKPSELPGLFGNKLDDAMMSSFLSCLKVKFDMKTEKDLVRDYLVSLTKCDRFHVIVSFLSAKDSNVARELIEELKSDEFGPKLMKDFCL